MKHDTAEKRQKRQEEFMKKKNSLQEELQKSKDYDGPKLSLAFGESYLAQIILKMGLSLKNTDALQDIDDDGYVYAVWKVSRNLGGKAIPQTERPIQVQDIRKMMTGKTDDELKTLFISKIWTKADVERVAVKNGRKENPFDELRSQLILVDKLGRYGWNDEIMDGEIFHEMVMSKLGGLINHLEHKTA